MLLHGPAGTRRAILLVEDEPAVRETMKEFLERGLLDTSVATAATAEEALARLEVDRFDVVISDQHLPGRSGLELLEAVAKAQPACRRVLLTGLTMPEVALRAASGAGIHGYIQKPYRRERVVARIRDLLQPAAADGRVPERAIRADMGRARTRAWHVRGDPAEPLAR